MAAPLNCGTNKWDEEKEEFLSNILQGYASESGCILTADDLLRFTYSCHPTWTTEQLEDTVDGVLELMGAVDYIDVDSILELYRESFEHDPEAVMEEINSLGFQQKLKYDHFLNSNEDEQSEMLSEEIVEGTQVGDVLCLQILVSAAFEDERNKELILKLETSFTGFLCSEDEYELKFPEGLPENSCQIISALARIFKLPKQLTMNGGIILTKSEESCIPPLTISQTMLELYGSEKPITRILDYQEHGELDEKFDTYDPYTVPYDYGKGSETEPYSELIDNNQHDKIMDDFHGFDLNDFTENCSSLRLGDRILFFNGSFNEGDPATPTPDYVFGIICSDGSVNANEEYIVNIGLNSPAQILVPKSELMVAKHIQYQHSRIQALEHDTLSDEQAEWFHSIFDQEAPLDELDIGDLDYHILNCFENPRRDELLTLVLQFLRLPTIHGETLRSKWMYGDLSLFLEPTLSQLYIKLGFVNDYSSINTTLPSPIILEKLIELENSPEHTQYWLSEHACSHIISHEDFLATYLDIIQLSQYPLTQIWGLYTLTCLSIDDFILAEKLVALGFHDILHTLLHNSEHIIIQYWCLLAYYFLFPAFPSLNFESFLTNHYLEELTSSNYLEQVYRIKDGQDAHAYTDCPNRDVCIEHGPVNVYYDYFLELPKIVLKLYKIGQIRTFELATLFSTYLDNSTDLGNIISSYLIDESVLLEEKATASAMNEQEQDINYHTNEQTSEAPEVETPVVESQEYWGAYHEDYGHEFNGERDVDVSKLFEEEHAEIKQALEEMGITTEEEQQQWILNLYALCEQNAATIDQIDIPATLDILSDFLNEDDLTTSI